MDKLAKLSIMIMILLLSVTTSMAITSQQKEKYLRSLNYPNRANIIFVAKKVSSAGLVDKEIYDKMAQLLKRGYSSAGEDRLAVDEMSWLCKALSSSGMPEYKPLIARVAKNAHSGKLRGYAQRSLEMFEEYAERNKIMANAANYRSDLSAEENRLINMLTSDKILLVRDAAKTLFRSKSMSVQVYDVASTELLRRYETQRYDHSGEVVDTLAWLCKAVGHSQNKKYRSTLEAIVKQERDKRKTMYDNDPLNTKLMDNAKLGLKLLQQ